VTAPLVVKVGGSVGIDLDAVCDDVATIWHDGREVVLVHGGSERTNQVATALGHPPRFVTSPSGHTSRYTDAETMEVFMMVYCGAVNKRIVERLQRRAVDAVGLSGLDGRLLEGRHKRSVRSLEAGKTRVLHGDHTGTVERVNDALLRLLLGAGHLPVVTPPAASFDGVAINVDGDRAAAAIAAALGATDLVILSNVPGLLGDLSDEASLVPALARSGIDAAIAHAGGRMKKKLLGAAEAIDGGVGRVVLGDARIAAPISAALAGRGTVIA
jgi:[amino group carrier protein]-L-2-aminoadipate 6-kinase